MTKAFNEKYHKDQLVDYVLSSWLTGYEMDYDSWMDNNANPIMIIHFSQNEKSIVIKREDFNKIILPEVEKKFNEYKKGFYDNTRSKG